MIADQHALAVDDEDHLAAHHDRALPVGGGQAAGQLEELVGAELDHALRLRLLGPVGGAAVDPAVAPAVEGLNSLTLGNAMMLSSFLGCTIEMPLDDEAYAAKLQELITNSQFEKTVREQEVTNFSDSF